MSEPPIEPLAAALGISLEPEWLESVRTNLRVSLAMGALVAGFDLGDEVEVAPVFQP